MKALILEDDKRRILWFEEKLKDAEADFTVKAKKCIELLKKNLYDIIFLDHDLDGKIFVPSEKSNTGYQVAKVIPETINKNTPVVIHSYNPDGAEKMRDAIGGSATLCSFGDFDIQVLDNEIKFIPKTVLNDFFPDL